jgi:hypothetical protein
MQSADLVAAAKTPVLSVQPRRAAIVIIGRDDPRRLIAMGTRRIITSPCFVSALTAYSMAHSLPKRSHTQLCSILLAESQVESSEQTTAPSKVAQVDHEAASVARHSLLRGACRGGVPRLRPRSGSRRGPLNLRVWNSQWQIRRNYP